MRNCCRNLSVFATLIVANCAWGADNVVFVGQDSNGAPALAFYPSTLNVRPGDTITFKNVTGGTHNAHSVDPAFAFQCGNGSCTSAAPAAGLWSSPTLTVPASAAGKTISYSCDLHVMKGQFVVSTATPITLQSFKVD